MYPRATIETSDILELNSLNSEINQNLLIEAAQ